MANNKRFTEHDIRRMLSNPIYTGIGPFPRLVDDDTWIKAQARSVADQGARRTLTTIRNTLHEALGRKVSCISHSTWINDSIPRIETEGAERFFRRLLSELRAELNERH